MYTYYVKILGMIYSNVSFNNCICSLLPILLDLRSVALIEIVLLISRNHINNIYLICAL